MKIIFLDIDGVFNSVIWKQNPKYTDKAYPYNLFDPTTVELFNNIIKETGAKVVITSTWRLKYSIQELRDIFVVVEFNCEIIDYTPALKKGSNYVLRGNEILKWCKDNRTILGVKYVDYKDYAIIDDNNDMLLWQANNFFQTDKQCGLSPEVSRTIIRALK